MTDVKNIAILGSTGSIGTQTLDIIEENPSRFRATVLTAGRNWELLARQAKKFLPVRAVIADPELLPFLREALRGLPVETAAGPEAIAEAAEMEAVDTVVTAMVGYSGLIPTLHAIRSGKTIALANKETLVVAGEIITRLVKEYDTKIIPVDSEHSAIFQCLAGEEPDNVSRIILTASGGPFRTFTAEQLENVTVEDALHHPNWSMGAKVTVDSASMMNKGFEMIEARWLFDCGPDRIDIAVHPQSIVHSMVEFRDGSVKAQLGVPDMHLPISYALSYPDRLDSRRERLSIGQYRDLTFEAPDMKRFPLLGFAFDAIKMGGNMPCILNAANEVAVAAFLRGDLRFTRMPLLVADVMERTPFIPVVALEQLVDTHREATAIALERLGAYAN